MRFALFTIYFSLFTFCFSLIISAQTIDSNRAKERVEAFLFANTNIVGAKAQNPTKATLILAYTSKSDDTVTYYAFNKSNGGFVVASADETAEPVLMYSETGSFDLENAPENFKWWLHQYERQIAFAKANAFAKVSPKGGDLEGASKAKSVSALCETKWNQQSPYYNQCPKTHNQRCLTGCVATAMAQVMKYHEWPVTGTGSHTYTDTPSSGQTITRNFSQHTYDWSNMLNKYSSSATTTQKDAVATLMADCGCAVQMEYSTDGSGAWTENVSYAFVNYFGYDKGVKHLYRDYFTDTEWDSICYNELINNRPIVYGGTGYDSDEDEFYGHSFVCDGYNATNDTYHFNWGWGGSYDCYCKLSAIKPYSGCEFDYYQDIIVGVQPAKEESTSPINIIIYEGGNLAYTQTTSGTYTTYTINFGEIDGQTCIIYTDSYQSFDAVFTMMYENTETGDVKYADVKDLAATKTSFTGIYPMQYNDDGYVTIEGADSLKISNVIVPNLPAGTYKVKVAYKNYTDRDNADPSLWQELRAFTGCTNYKTLVVEATLPGDANADGTIDVTDITTVAAYILSPTGELKGSLKNADANQDGLIDVTDITTIATIILQ